MSKINKSGTSSFWVIGIALGLLACLAGVVYTFITIQQETGQEGEYRLLANDMRLLSQEIAVNSRETGRGDASTAAELSANIDNFNILLNHLNSTGLENEAGDIATQWRPLEQAVETLVATAPRIAFIYEVANELETNIRPIQSEFTAIVGILREENAATGTSAAAQESLWLTERIARNIDKILAGESESQLAADEFRSDAANFTRNVDALKNGNKVIGVEKLRDRDAIDSIDTAAQLFAVVSTSVEQIASASTELRAAATARHLIAGASPQLSEAVLAMMPAIGELANTGFFNRGSLMALFGAPAILAVGLLVVMYRGQRRRVLYTESGVAQINGALVRIAEGDLTIRVPEENSVTRDIAREINASTERQRELIRNIRTPFEVSIKEIGKIGKTALDQVDKGRQLTRSVADSTTAATEMVRISEEIKNSTVEAAKTTEQNREQVARGYELTKDMSKASADVRESVQETSKSAKRQGELIQSVTTAAEYIQALNTKISVVAVTTKIEAEKAGEYGRPFLGIAEAIGDLLREAEEEGRKIISEVRMLQGMSAENLGSMENTVGTVVTILEYIERLDSSLEEINDGSSAITSIITSVDEAAGQSANSALHMNSSMARISERNLDISEYSEHTQAGVSNLQKSMRNVAESLSQFRIEEGDVQALSSKDQPGSLESIKSSRKIYREDEMSALESEERDRLTV